MYYIPYIPPETMIARVTLEKTTSKKEAHAILDEIQRLRGVFNAVAVDDIHNPHEILVTYKGNDQGAAAWIRARKGVQAISSSPSPRR